MGRRELSICTELVHPRIIRPARNSRESLDLSWFVSQSIRILLAGGKSAHKGNPLVAERLHIVLRYGAKHEPGQSGNEKLHFTSQTIDIMLSPSHE